MCVLESYGSILNFLWAAVPSLKDGKAPADVFLSRAVPFCPHTCLENGSTCWESWAACWAWWAALWWSYTPQRTRRSPLWRKWLPSWRSLVRSRPCFPSGGWAVQTARCALCLSFEFFSPSCRFLGLCCDPPGSLLPPDLLPRTPLRPEQHPHLPHHLLRYRRLLRVLSQGLGNCHQGLLCWPACAAAPTDVDPGHHPGGVHHHTDQLPQQVPRHFQHLFGVPHLLRAVHHHRHHHFHHPL